ncbi:MAG: hypothetical protein Q4P78_05790 [Rothia sp. (in: high G+C Gram-positive bacteria)]|uniref:hypothetical protein n=1 Tax=Rothia sp. (in: high G+C Gram-positive bacteria) TaxID=1885016 RepID=UPI0026DEF9B7|nr:hypothetical protein [Rothia sp. (in: high G+C Gram-positive bacteria)]MDO5750700.1 hypothetical protein [Rothia sp. (in: high G+C Gram-positive bacteria)]
MDLPNLLENALTMYTSTRARTYRGGVHEPIRGTGNVAATSGESSGIELSDGSLYPGHAPALIWRDVHWVDRRPVLELEPVIIKFGASGVSESSESDTVNTDSQQSSQNPHRYPEEMMLSGQRLRIPLTPGAFLGARVLRDSSGEPYTFCGGFTIALDSEQNSAVAHDGMNNSQAQSTGAHTPAQHVNDHLYLVAESATAAAHEQERAAHRAAHGVRIQRVPCPENTRITRGKQCERCAARDEFTAIHGVHRGATLSAGMRAYAAQEHSLYVATFPDGSSKVGTVSARSNPRRLDEQAVATATLIAHASNGADIRRAEDAVSENTELVQVKQLASKYRAWLNPLPGVSLRAAHEQAVIAAREALLNSGLMGAVGQSHSYAVEPLEQPWIPSPAMTRPYASLRAQSPEPLGEFPSLLESEGFGFFCTGATGKFLSVHTGDADAALLANAGVLANKLLVLEDSLSRVETQAALF